MNYVETTVVTLVRCFRLVLFLIAPMSVLLSGPKAFAWVETVEANKNGESGRAKGTYFHIVVEYLVGESETLVFDLQVSCGNHEFGDGRIVHGYLPALYAKETVAGSAVMIATPRVCDAIRSAEGRPVTEAPEFKASWQGVLAGHFIPFTVWFEDAEDLTLGYGFAEASAFENPASPLAFVRAHVEPSNARTFSKWFSADKNNLLQEQQIGPRFANNEADKAYWSVFAPDKKLLPLSCMGVAVTTHGEGPSQEVVRGYYPENNPSYWLAPPDLPDRPIGGSKSKLDLVPKTGAEYYDSSPSQEFPVGYNYLRTAPTGGGVPENLNGAYRVFYPATRTDGYPFVRESAFRSARLGYRVDLTPQKRGLLSCFSLFNPIGYGGGNFQDLYEFYFGPDYGPKLVRFGKSVDLTVTDKNGETTFEAIGSPLALPHFLIGQEAVAEFVRFEFFGGGHVN